MPKIGPFWRVFDKPKACGQTVLPDRSVLIGQKLVESAQIQTFKCDILSNFQTMCNTLEIFQYLLLFILKDTLLSP